MSDLAPDVRLTIALALQAAESDALQDGKIPGYSMWADAVLAALQTGGWLFTVEDARLMRLAIDWIASELRDQEIPPSEYVGTRTFLNEMITRFDTYAALVGSDTPWARGEAQR